MFYVPDDPTSGWMIHAVSVVIHELRKLLTVGVTKHLTASYRLTACPSPACTVFLFIMASY